MKKISIVSLLVSIVLLANAMFLMWNIGIASDEQIKVVEFDSQYSYVFWLYLFLSFGLVLLNLLLYFKSSKIKYFMIK